MSLNLKKWALIAALGAALGATAPSKARAQFAVIDPANLAQSILQVTHMVEQISNQVRQVEQAAAMLASNPLNLSSDLTASLQETRALFDTVEGLSFEANKVGEDIRTLYPETWETFELGAALRQSDAWLSEGRRSLERAVEAEARATAALEQSAGRIERALGASSDAEGQTSAIQAGNQLLGLQAQQLADITALLAAQGRALETERLEQIARQQRGREIQRRAFPAHDRTAPAPARSAFE